MLETKYGYAQKIEVKEANMNPSLLVNFAGGLYYILYTDKEYASLTKYQNLLKQGTIMKIEEVTTSYGKKIITILEDVREKYKEKFRMRSEVTRTSRRDTCIQKLKNLLPEKNVHGGLDLALFPIDLVKPILTHGLLGPILGRTIDYISGADLIQIAEMIGYNVRQEAEIYIVNHPVLLQRIQALGYQLPLTNISGDNLEIIIREIKKYKRSEQEYLRIENKRGQQKEQAKRELLEELQEKKINNALKLLLFGTEHFEDTFGRIKIGTIIGRTLSSQVLRKDLLDLSVEFGRDLYQDVRNLLKKKAGIHDMNSLLAYPVTKFKQTIGIRVIGIINEKYSRGNQNDIIKMGNRLRGETSDSIVTILRKKGITNAIQLIQKDPSQLRDIKKPIGKFVGMSRNNITIQEKYILCEKLGRDIAKEVSDRIRKSMAAGHDAYHAIEHIQLKRNTIKVIYDFLPTINQYLGFDLIKELAGDLELDLAERKITTREGYDALHCKEIIKFGLRRIGLILGRSIKEVLDEEKNELGNKLRC